MEMETIFKRRFYHPQAGKDYFGNQSPKVSSSIHWKIEGGLGEKPEKFLLTDQSKEIGLIRTRGQKKPEQNADFL